ncbi:MAG TPA: GMC family oxidoreductase [Gemmatimonadaceae bacterium]|nr:GMC family oxidoreductase [Gemmatimonadaceae bacterium]
MHTDARTLEDGRILDADLCIVGAGAAGISIAREWIGAARTVLLLEGGGFEYDARMQDLYRGESVGLPYFPLHAARLHYFGGTTGHWAGFCSTFDDIDFVARPWVPHSGWPITRASLDPYYARAHRVLELGPYEYDIARWRRRNPSLVPLPLDPRTVWTKVWQFSPPTRMGTRYRDEIVGARNVHLLTHANVCEVETNEAASAVTGVRIRTFEGKELRARAKHYVLACSTIQNARLLLASNTHATAGLGNAHDLVGRYFMEHLEMPSGELVFTGKQVPNTAMYDFVWGKTKTSGELALSEAMQRAGRLLNATVSTQPATPGQAARSTFQNITPERLEARRRAEQAGRSIQTPPETPRPAESPRVFELHTRQEQAPNPASRVTIARERDALGLPRVVLDWRLTPLDRRSFRAFYEVLGRELGRSGIGRVRRLDWVTSPDDAPWPATLGGGWHHMGTTRMHRDPKQGVVDMNCRVHGVANLSVAGDAVFPTSGSANPTLTLVALSLRLSDHLKITLG